MHGGDGLGLCYIHVSSAMSVDAVIIQVLLCGYLSRGIHNAAFTDKRQIKFIGWFRQSGERPEHTAKIPSPNATPLRSRCGVSA